jgi:hypothetical protein
MSPSHIDLKANGFLTDKYRQVGLWWFEGVIEMADKLLPELLKLYSAS